MDKIALRNDFVWELCRGDLFSWTVSKMSLVTKIWAFQCKMVKILGFRCFQTNIGGWNFVWVLSYEVLIDFKVKTGCLARFANKGGFLEHSLLPFANVSKLRTKKKAYISLSCKKQRCCQKAWTCTQPLRHSNSQLVHYP